MEGVRVKDERGNEESNEEKLGGKEMKKELSWRDCYIRPFGLQTPLGPLRTPR